MPETKPTATRRRGAAGALVVALLGGCTGEAPGAGPNPGPPSSLAAVRVDHPLDVRVTRVETFPVKGKVPFRRIRPAAEQVGRTMTELYTSAFLDPVAWKGGRFPEIFRHFRGDAKRQARQDRDRLTLGRAAERLSEVRPRRARLRVDVVTGPTRRPVAVLARMRFVATGLSEDGVETPIRHRAQYLLRRFGGRWQVVAYRVKRRVVPEAIPGIRTDGTLFVLALGSDARPGQSVARSRADSIHVIGVNLREGKASILGIPRDSYVPIPGHGSNKINAALFFGGPQLMVRTVQGLTGILMDGYLLTGFEGFTRMVNGIGGITVTVPYPMSDRLSRAYFRPGPRPMNGQRALAFSRNRHDGPGGDFGRSLNHGRVIVSALRELRKDVARDPLTLFRWLQVAADHLQTDLSIAEKLGLLFAALSTDPARVRNRVASGGGGTVGSQSVVHLGPGARTMFRDLGRDGVLGQ